MLQKITCKCSILPLSPDLKSSEALPRFGATAAQRNISKKKSLIKSNKLKRHCVSCGFSNTWHFDLPASGKRDYDAVWIGVAGEAVSLDRNLAVTCVMRRWKSKLGVSNEIEGVNSRVWRITNGDWRRRFSFWRHCFLFVFEF